VEVACSDRPMNLCEKFRHFASQLTFQVPYLREVEIKIDLVSLILKSFGEVEVIQ
jgi:hypothetical protein